MYVLEKKKSKTSHLYSNLSNLEKGQNTHNKQKKENNKDNTSIKNKSGILVSFLNSKG